MWDRILLALDQYESGQSALRLTTHMASVTQGEVRVLHIRELSKWTRVPPLETPNEAQLLVDEAVFSLRLAGVPAEGRSCSVLADRVALRIVEESLSLICDAIVLGTRRLHGLGRLSGHGVREQVLRMSPLPVIAAPTPLTNAVHTISGFGLADNDERDRPETRHDESPWW